MTSPEKPRRFTRKRMVAAYVLLLALSWGVRKMRPDPSPPEPGQHTVGLQEIDVREATGRTITLAYYDISEAPGASGYPLLLVHGTPVASRSFQAAREGLKHSARLIIPDLPGFGRSTQSLPDYSIESHARYLLQLMDHLGIEKAHLLGYSQGGGVVQHMADLAPERTASLILASSIGVQELEWLGEYYLNHGLYALQWSVIALIQEGLPHFGYLDNMYLNLNYARNFFDTDQRPLRDILLRYDGPALIVQGEKDLLVPPAAAREHARLLPQSELAMLAGGHLFMIHGDAKALAQIATFIQAVDAGTAVTRDTATAERLTEAAQPFDFSRVPRPQGLMLVIVFILIAISTHASEDLSCVGAGLMAANGNISYWTATLACLVGIFVGDLLLFAVGRYVGMPAVRHPPFKWMIPPDKLAFCRSWFEEHGHKVILLSRFVPGTRLPTYVAAGMTGMKIGSFIFYFLLAAALWTPLLVGLAWWVGKPLLHYLEVYQEYALWMLLAFILMFILINRLVLPLMSFRGRRLLLSGWRRRTRWEFWPPWFFYPPVIGYVLLLAIRHRGLNTFTASNPAMFAGGFIGESKTEILHGLGAYPEFVAAHAFIPRKRPRQERCDTARAFMQERGLSFPVVVKPDEGQRGAGVRLVKDGAQLQDLLATVPYNVIIQEHVPGREFGVFYYRMPGNEKGRIFSITDKRFTAVTGNGRHNLEHLILSDDRAVCQARLHIRNNQHRLDAIPAEGEEVTLIELGTHCRGALFLDGRHLLTPALEARIDKISRAYDGFYFGRYDIRTPSVEDFQAGENFKIIELNGVTSEATHIYHPGFPLGKAYRTLFEQWRIAFEIGARNRKRGDRPVSILTLARLFISYEKPA